MNWSSFAVEPSLATPAMLHRCFKGDKVVRPASGTYPSSRCRDDVMVARPDFPNSFVGIFWAIQEQGAAISIEDHQCSLKEAEPYGAMLTCPHGHYDVWEQWRKAGGRAAIAGPNTRNGRADASCMTRKVTVSFSMRTLKSCATRL